MDSPPLPTYTYAYTSPLQPKPQAPTTSSHPLNAPPSPAPSDPTTPYRPSSTTSSPIYEIPPTPTPEPGTSRPTTLIYGNRLLPGSLYYITPSDFLNKFFARVLDIDAASEPAVEDVSDPYLLVHCVLGRSWCDGRLLPLRKEGEAFVAVTDDWSLFEEEGMGWEGKGEGLGRCGIDASYTPSVHLTTPTTTGPLQPDPNTFPGFLTPEANPPSSSPSQPKSNNLLLALPPGIPIPQNPSPTTTT
ncbi:hypothetical protein KC357_g9197, partial [Hortaea werneckii]